MLQVESNSVKIICLQVHPGKELGVASSFMQHQGCTGGNFSVIKGLGYWDLIVLYYGDSFESDITRFGPVKGISNSLTYLCYQLAWTEEACAARYEADRPFIGFVHIKLDSYSPNFKGSNVQQLYEDLFSCGSDDVWIKLGTLGWNDLVFVCYSSTLESLAKSVSLLNRKLESNRSHLITKIYSHFGLDYSHMPTAETVKCGVESVARHFRDINVCGKLGEDLRLHVNVSAQPTYYRDIMLFWKRNGASSISSVFGDNDISVVMNKEIAWSHFLSSLLCFRYEFRNKVLSTSTGIEIIDNMDSIGVARTPLVDWPSVFLDTNLAV